MIPLKYIVFSYLIRIILFLFYKDMILNIFMQMNHFSFLCGFNSCSSFLLKLLYFFILCFNSINIFTYPFYSYRLNYSEIKMNIERRKEWLFFRYNLLD